MLVTSPALPASCDAMLPQKFSAATMCSTFAVVAPVAAAALDDDVGLPAQAPARRPTQPSTAAAPRTPLPALDRVGVAGAAGPTSRRGGGERHDANPRRERFPLQQDQ